MVVGGSKCVLADGDCRGRLEWHHAIRQQRLRREFPHGAYRIFEDDPWQPVTRTGFEYTQDIGFSVVALADILGDKRNRIWLCSHHHELVTNGRLGVPIPQSVWEFADEYGLRAMLENDLARRAA